VRVRPASFEDRVPLIELIKGYFACRWSRRAPVGFRHDASLQYASARGYARLAWVTAQDNRAAQRFYERHGGRRGPWVSYSATPAAR